MTARKMVLRCHNPLQGGYWLQHVGAKWSRFPAHAVFDHQIHVWVSYEVQFGIRIF